MKRGIWRELAGVAVFAAALALTAVAALAQSPPGGADDLRPLYANAADIRDGKDLADASCASCHGPDGVSARPGVPNVAGQRPAFLYRKLKAFQQGDVPGGGAIHDRRLLKFLSEAALSNVAAYYSSLDPAPPPPGEAPQYRDPVAAGKAAAEPCAKCHGEGGISRKEGVPSLVAQDPKYLVETMKAYKEGDRPIDDKNADMKSALDALDSADLQRIALYYALQRDNPTRAQTKNPGGAPVAKETLAACDKCHDKVGPIMPALAGQDATYAFKALEAYKEGVRDDVAMSPKAKKLTVDEMKNLAAYYAALDPKPLEIRKPLSPDEWAEKCDRCHGANGNSARPEVPALAGQRRDYLEKALAAYRKGERTSPEMDAMASILTDDDIRGLAAHYSSRQGRAAIFIPVPAK